LSSIDLKALSDYYLETVGDTENHFDEQQKVTGARAFFSTSAGMFVHVGDDVFHGDYIGKIARIIKHKSTCKYDS
jgi:hypothetical protein